MESCLGNNKIVLTIDLGHCETVVSCNDYNRSPQDALWQISMKTAVSIILQEGKETVCVGDSAVNYQSIAKNSQIYFRKSPSEMSAEEVYCFKRFLQGVYFYVLEKYPELNTKAHCVCLLLPSYGKNWDKDYDIYLDLLSEAGLPDCRIGYKKHFSHTEERSSSFVSIVIGEEETYVVCYLHNLGGEYLLLDILPYQKVIKSAVSIIEQEGQQTVCIGEEALLWAKEEVLSSFKTRPSLMNESERKLLCAFIKNVYENILKQPIVQKNVTKVQLVVPSSHCCNSHDFEEYRLICSEVKIPLANIEPSALFLFKRLRHVIKSPVNGTIIVEINKDNIAISQICKDTEELESTHRFSAFNADSYRLQDTNTNVYSLMGKTVLSCLLKYLSKHPSDEYMANLFERFEKYGHIPSYHQLKMMLENALYFYFRRMIPRISCTFDYQMLTSCDSEYVEDPISGFGGISIERAELCEILQDYYAAVQQSVDKYIHQSLRNICPPYVILRGFYCDDGIRRCLETCFQRTILIDNMY